MQGSNDIDLPDGWVVPAYEELRRLARSHMRHERTEHTLSPTGLVHEAWIRLAGQRQDFENRSHFLGAVSHTMRRVLVDHARSRTAGKRHGVRVPLTSIDVAADAATDIELLAIDAALDKLATIDERLVRVVECRYFAGLTIPETAEALGVSHTTVSEDWRFARAFLRRALRAAAPAGGTAVVA